MWVLRFIPLIVLFPVLMTGAPSKASAAPFKEMERFYTVALDGKRLGYDHYQHVRTQSGNLETLSDSLMKVSILGSSLDVTTQTIAEYAADGVTPLTCALTLTQGSNTITVKCHFAGRAVEWEEIKGGQTEHRSVAIPPGTVILVDNGSWSELVKRADAGKKAFKTAIFTPVLGKTATITLTRAGSEPEMVDGKPVQCELWTTEMPTLAGMTPVALAIHPLTRELTAVRMPTLKVAMQLSDKSALKGLVNYDLTSRAFAATDVALPSSELTRVTIHATAKVVSEKITNESLQHAPIQAFQGKVKDGVADGVFTVNAFHYDGAHAAAFPYTADSVGAQGNWLKPDMWAEVDDPDIRALSAKLTANAHTGWEAAAKIGHWVFDNIAYRITGSSAKVCLKNKEGDCGPHTMLTIALCRAAGIPARSTGGALYTPLLGGSYGQHFWVRVWMGPADGWVPMDPTTGEIGTLSPAHLTLWNLGSLGALSVKILDYAPKAAASAAAPNAAVAVRHSNGLAQGYTEKYIFKLNHKEIGWQTASLDSVTGDEQAWKFDVKLDIPQSNQTLSITEDGTLNATSTGVPVKMAMKVNAAGIEQDIAVDFGKASAHALISAGNVKSPRDIPLTGGEFIGLNNNITAMSLAIRSSDLTGKTISIPFLFVDSLQPLTLKLTPLQEETLQIGGKTFDCQTYKADPINETFWVDKVSGALIKATDPRQNLEMTREAE